MTEQLELIKLIQFFLKKKNHSLRKNIFLNIQEMYLKFFINT